MKILDAAALTLAALLAAPLTALAQSNQTPVLDKREAKLNADEAKAKADGVVTKKERARLQSEANRDSRKIFRKKHNARTTSPSPGPAR